MSRGGLSSSRVTTGPKDPHATSRIWTPLRENHFEPPLLSARERAYLVRKSCEAAQELVGRARSTGGPMTWHHVEKHNGVQIYAGVPRSNATGTALTAAIMCGVTSVPGTMKEVALLFDLSSTRQMKEFAQAHREWFYDGVVLHTLAPRTQEKPLHQVTAKWMIVPMPRGIPHRDFCYLECQDKFIDARGRKGWVLGQHSIKLPGCDDLKKEFGVVRGSLYNSGLVVVESEERSGYLDVIYLVQLNLKEHTPVPMSLLRARVLFVAQVRNMLRSKRLNEQRYLSDLELVPRKYRARCAVCHDSFSLLLLRKMNCRKCGEVVCAACSKEFPIENRNFAATNGGDDVRKLRICMHCFQVITNAPKPTSALVEPPHSSTMSMSFLGYCDDDQHAAYRVGQDHSHREEEVPKIFLQSMRREKPSGYRMSSTLPIPRFGADVPPSTSQYFTRGEPNAEQYQRSRRYQQQDYGRSHNHRGSQRMQPSDFRPSQSLSLDDPIARGESRYTSQLPGPPAGLPPASIFDRPATGDSRRPHHGSLRSSSSDMLGGTSSGNMSNFSRLQQLSSRERLEQLMREDDYTSQSSVDHRMPDAYMSALQQASRDKHGYDVPPPMYQTPPSDFGAYGATSNDQPVIPPDFGPYDDTLDDLDGPPPLDVSALTSSASTIPIELNSMSALVMSPTAPRDGGNERRLLRLRENEIQQRRESTSSGSSANSIDIDTYEDSPRLVVVPPIPEQQQRQGGEQCHEEDIEHLMLNSTPPNMTSVQNLTASRENGKKAASIHDTGEDSETSMGASDDEEERCASVNLAPSLTIPPLRGPIDDSTEEAKAQESAESTGLPSPSPSAHAAPRKMLERVQPKPIKEEKAIVKELNDHDRQLQRSNVKDFAGHEYHQMHVPPTQSEVQVADGKECEDGVEANFLARKDTAGRRNKQGEDEEGIASSRLKDDKSAVPEISSISASQASEALPPHERTATPPISESGITLAVTKHSRSVPDNMEMEECQKPLNHRNGFGDHVSARGSSICSMGLDSRTPPATPPSTVAFSILDTSASSPTTVPAINLAASSSVRASQSNEVAMSPQSNTNAPPAYVPESFQTKEQLQEVHENVSTKSVSLTPMVSSTPRQRNDSNAALDNFELNFSASFNAHQQRSDDVVDGHSPLVPYDRRNRVSNHSSNNVQVLRYQSVGSSVLDSAPDSAPDVSVLSASTSDGDSEGETTLVLGRQPYGRSGNTTQMSRDLSQIQQGFD